jgi:hypothetical protein
LFQPSPFAAGEALPEIVGAVASRLIVTESVEVPPVLVAVHVNVTPVVSLVTEFVASQSTDLDVIAESGSLTLNVTVTSLLYQPLSPSVPVMVWVMTGGVASDGGAGFTCSVNAAGLVFQRLPDFPPVKEKAPLANVYVPAEAAVNEAVRVLPQPTN